MYHITDLPSEVTSQIFGSYLSPGDLDTIKRTSKRWAHPGFQQDILYSQAPGVQIYDQTQIIPRKSHLYGSNSSYFYDKILSKYPFIPSTLKNRLAFFDIESDLKVRFLYKYHNNDIYNIPGDFEIFIQYMGDFELVNCIYLKLGRFNYKLDGQTVYRHKKSVSACSFLSISRHEWEFQDCDQVSYSHKMYESDDGFTTIDTYVKFDANYLLIENLDTVKNLDIKRSSAQDLPDVWLLTYAYKIQDKQYQVDVTVTHCDVRVKIFVYDMYRCPMGVDLDIQVHQPSSSIISQVATTI